MHNLSAGLTNPDDNVRTVKFKPRDAFAVRVRHLSSDLIMKITNLILHEVALDGDQFDLNAKNKSHDPILLTVTTSNQDTSKETNRALSRGKGITRLD